MKPQTLTKLQTVTSHEIANDEFFTTNELMKLLKIKHRQTIYELIKSGLPAILVGKNYRFIKQEVISFLKKRSQNRNSRESR